MKYVVEHLEPRLYKWCLLEYAHISGIVGRNNLVFTNTRSCRLQKYGAVARKSAASLSMERPCLLDPSAKRALSPGDCFSHLIFGGILGDEPMAGRTARHFAGFSCARRNLGRKQMSTDTAVYVAKQIIHGKRLSGIRFADCVEVGTGRNESMILPFRFVLVNKKPLLAPGLRNLLRKGF